MGVGWRLHGWAQANPQKAFSGLRKKAYIRPPQKSKKPQKTVIIELTRRRRGFQNSNVRCTTFEKGLPALGGVPGPKEKDFLSRGPRNDCRNRFSLRNGHDLSHGEDLTTDKR